MSLTERRCSNCGALVAADAEWCGQCLRPLRDERPPEPEPAPIARPQTATPGGEPTWTCPTCEHVNVLVLERCEACGTPFARLFAEPEPVVEIAPSRALGWSLLVPGLGHWMAGRRADGVARMVLFGWTFGTCLVLLVSGSDGGLGRAGVLLGLFAAAAVALYVLSAVDAWRIAAGQDPIVRSRTLLWASVGLVVVSVVLATLLSLPVARGG